MLHKIDRRLVYLYGDLVDKTRVFRYSSGYSEPSIMFPQRPYFVGDIENRIGNADN